MSRVAGPSTPARGATPELSRGASKPLPERERLQMERGLGIDLSAIRIHGSRVPREEGANALAVGGHILLPYGEPVHTSTLRHEVVHSVQHARGGIPPTLPLESAWARLEGRTVAGDAAEREADHLSGPRFYAPERVQHAHRALAGEWAPTPAPAPGVNVPSPPPPVSSPKAAIPDVDMNATPARAENTRAGLVQLDEGTKLQASPGGGETVAVLPLNTLVYVHSEEAGWYQVTTSTGKTGYVEVRSVVTGLPDPEARLYRIQPGEGALAIAHRFYGSDANVWGADERFYVNVLVLVNEQQNRKGIFKPPGETDWDKTQTLEGRQIWIPGLTFAKTLRGVVSSGSISYETLKSVQSGLNTVAEIALGTGSFIVGLLHGALESIWDTLVGIVELIGLAGTLIKQLVTGTLLSDASAFMKELADLDFKQLAAMGMQAFDAKWNNPDLLARWHFRGWLIGYIVAEILMLVFSEGILTGLKWVGKTAKLGKLLELMPRLAKVVEGAKALKGTKAVVELGSAVKASEKLIALRKWVVEVIRVPLDVLSNLSEAAIQRIKAIPAWAQKELAAFTDVEKRIALGCASPCKVNPAELYRRINRLVEWGGVTLRGFRNGGEVAERFGNLRNRLLKYAEDVRVGIRGSSVTGISTKTGEAFRWESAMAKASDIDYFMTSKALEDKLVKAGAAFKDGVLDPVKLKTLNPALYAELMEFSAQTSAQLGRKASVYFLKQSLVDSLPAASHVIYLAK